LWRYIEGFVGGKFLVVRRDGQRLTDCRHLAVGKGEFEAPGDPHGDGISGLEADAADISR
jgi:hypothetical protein